MLSVGIDIGSTSTKSVIMNEKKDIIAYDVIFTGGNNRDSAQRTFENVLEKTNLNKQDIDRVIATGYGRENVSFSDKNVSEIICHAKGMYLYNNELTTILDIGGQDSKVIQLGENGDIVDFQMNDKCAAGCGRFLDIIAKVLNVKLEDLGQLSMQTKETAKITSMCSVFAETEVVSLVAIGTPISQIINGVHDSIAQRAVSLLNIVGIKGYIGMSGGVAKNIGVVNSLERILGTKIYVPELPQIIGAAGAAYIGQD